jgi:hypothetical protein
MMISPEYREMNAALHASNAAYGTSGHKWATDVSDLVKAAGLESVLDYGCGKDTLKEALGPRSFEFRSWDPAFHDHVPQPADLVVCTDVLEHIEPDCLSDVLDDLRRCTLKFAFLVIATRPAKKTLADGRNAHLLVRSAKWWLPKIMDRWTMINFVDMGGEFVCVVRA